jgi:hypothetical protein
MIPLLLQGTEWLIVLIVAIPIIAIGLVVYVVIKLGLAGGAALNRMDCNIQPPAGSPPQSPATGFCAYCGGGPVQGAKFCPH